MKTTRFSVEEIVAVLKQAEMGMPVADLVWQIDICEQIFYRWKKPYQGLESDQVRELKPLQEEHARWKRLVTELSLDQVMLQDVAPKNGTASVKEASGGRWSSARGLAADGSGIFSLRSSTA